MKRKKYLPYVVFILISLAAGGLSSIAVSKGLAAYEQVVKPPLTPPSALFPIVWTILYVLMGIGAAMVWNTASPGRSRAIAAYGAQLVFNALWSVWFFTLQAYSSAFVWLLALILLVAVMLFRFYKIDRAAGLIQLPYLVWCVFAAYLNLGVWLLNR